MYKTLLSALLTMISFSSAVAIENTPPIALDDYGTCYRGSSVTLSILENDYDVDGSLDIYTVDLDIFTSGIQSSARISEGIYTIDTLGMITFTPFEGFFGQVSYIYSVCDNMGEVSNTATITINVVDIAHSVTYDANGGINAPIDSNAYYEWEEITISDSIPSREGFIFEAWIYDSTGYVASDYLTMPFYDITLVALWYTKQILITHSVTYDANGGINAPASTQGLLDGDKITISDSIPIKEGYIFTGWAYEDNTYLPSDYLIMPFSDITLVAMWTISSSLTDVNDLTLTIAPNPTSGYVTIDKSVDHIKTYTLSGSLVNTYTNIPKKTPIDITSYPAGIYLLHINKGSENTIIKLIKE